MGSLVLREIHGVLHVLQVDISSTVILHELQREKLHHKGPLHGLKSNLLQYLEYLLSLLHWMWYLQNYASYFLSLVSPSYCTAFFYLLLNILFKRGHQHHWGAQIWSGSGSAWRWLKLSLSYMRTASGVFSQKPLLKAKCEMRENLSLWPDSKQSYL